ncbi:MAG TPA: twin-arginine translocation signal domain-containing protein [Planctomycetaceae bacterium]|nr:twin-arginine translocation signal domain-containing protein [Planctomycetaceae bacterium]
MLKNPSRRNFLKTTGAVAATALVDAPRVLSAHNAASALEKRWFKGNLHMHNQWSDGKPLPEWAIDWYRTHGYDFICPSDHNIFQSDKLRFDGFGFNNQPSDLAAFKDETSLWKVISPTPGWPKLTQNYVDETVAKFGNESVRTITVGGKTYVRMTPFSELERRFAEPGKFLMIPGYEQTGGCRNEQQVHMNFINVRDVFPYISAELPKDILEQTVAKGQEIYAGQDYIVTANHPLWRFYDYSPTDLIALPQIRLFEVNNNNVDDAYDAHPQGWKPEKFWDVVNAHRASHDQPLLLGMGSDDRHSYDSTAKGWSVVRAASLSVNDLLEAIRTGDFYASNGLDFQDIQFDGKTLSVKLDVREEGRYRIQFIGTKRDYDPSSRVVEVEEGPRCPARKFEVFSDTIGVVLDTVEGPEGSYTLKSDDLYIRAKVVKVAEDLQPDWQSHPAAWTQPHHA